MIFLCVLFVVFVFQHLDLDEDYEIPEPKYVIPPPSNKQLDPEDDDHKGFADDMQWHSRLKYLEIVTDDSFRNHISPNCDDNEYEPIESPPASLLMVGITLTVVHLL